jgi:hypothetical protein
MIPLILVFIAGGIRAGRYYLGSGTNATSDVQAQAIHMPAKDANKSDWYADWKTD